MKQLRTIRVNTFHLKKEEKSIPFHELVFLVQESTYQLSNSDEVSKIMKLEDLRMMVSNESIDQMIEVLKEIKDKIE